MNLFFREIKKMLRPINVVSLIFLNFVIIILLNAIFAPAEMAFAGLEFCLVVLGISYTTFLYKKYSKQWFLKINELNSVTKKQLQFNFFAISFLFLMLESFIWISILFLVTYFGLVNDINFSNNYNRPVMWNSNGIKANFLIYAIILESIIIIFYTYFLNHFIKNKTLLSAIVVLNIAGFLILGDMVPVYLGKSDGVWYWSKDSNVKFIIKLVIWPWMQVGIFAKRTMYGGEWAQGYYWNYSSLGVGRILVWTPYLYLVLLIGIPKAHSHINKLYH